MAALLLRRLATLLVTLLAMALIVFLVLEILPGDPAAVMLGIGAQPDTLAALRAQLGLDQPAALRFFVWLGDLLTGDLGRSYVYGVPVADLVAERLVLSLPLALLAMALATSAGIPLGVLAAARRGRPVDAGVMATTQLGIAIPNFWLAMLLVLLFAVRLGWFQAGGFAGWQEGIGAGLRSLVLPATALALPQAAILARVTRSAVLEALGEDHIRTARAKGLTRAAVLWRHAVPNALVPVVTIMGLQLSFLLAGTIIIENLFFLPGLGRLLFQAIAQRDLITVKSLVVLLAGTVVLVNFLVDLLYLWLDPRRRHA